MQGTRLHTNTFNTLVCYVGRSLEITLVIATYSFSLGVSTSQLMRPLPGFDFVGFVANAHHTKEDDWRSVSGFQVNKVGPEL